MTRALPVVLSVVLAACGGSSGNPDAGTADAGTSDAGLADAGAPDGDLDGGTACAPGADDYTPRIAASATDTWPACITDTAATYPPIDPSISSAARVAAFDDIFAPDFGGAPGILFGPDRDPTAAEFLEARMVYQTDNGLESRIGRRPDVHYEEPVPPATCTDEYVCRCLDVAAASPDYCAGPALLQPIVLQALNQGITMDPAEPSRVYAARAEAALTWVLYLSSLKESLSCAEAPRDCDSSWAYYTGGRERGDGLGLARMVRALEPETHERIWDALLAVRCWRDLDDATPATDAALQARARDQQDRALLRGMIAIVVDRLRALEGSSGDAPRAHLAWLRTLMAPIPEHTITDGTSTYTVAAHAPLLDRPIRAIDPEGADLVAAEIQEEPGAIDVEAIIAVLEAAYPCP